MMTTRRNFLKISMVFAFNYLLGNKNSFANSSELEQNVRINLPAYTLKLMNYKDGNLKEKIFPIGIGKGYYGRKQTPINDGLIYEKREQVLFRYGKDYPNLGIKKGDIIKWTNTFDENGKPEGYRMPYSKMRGLAMKINSPYANFYYDDFVIHSTTDEFTIGTPCSSGCIRVGMKDMLNLYDIVRPQIEKGILKKPVPIEILYDLVEINKDSVMLHANVYNKNINMIQEFKEKIKSTRFKKEDFNYDKIKKSFELDGEEFKKTHKHILKILSRGFPKNFVPLFLRKKLHKNYDITEFLRS